MNVRQWILDILNWKVTGASTDAPARAVAEPDAAPSPEPRSSAAGGPNPAPAGVLRLPDTLQLPESPRVTDLQAARPDYLVFVGVDFGTSGTKVVFRDTLAKERERTPYALDFGTTVKGFSRFSYPSAIAVEGDELLLGQEAELAPPPAVVLRSAKMFLLSRHKWKDSAFEEALAEGYTGEGRPDCAYEFAATLLVAEVIRRTRRALRDAYPGIDLETQVNWSIDVPVDHSEPEQVREPFRRVLDTALVLCDVVRPRMRLSEMVPAWMDAMPAVAAVALLPEEERRTQVVPEAVAILEGVRDFAPAEWGRNYAVVDVGAGTTDVGIFRVNPVRGNPTMPFLAASTLAVGCDNVDRGLCDRVVDRGARDRTLVGHMREAKMHISPGATVPLTLRSQVLRITFDHLTEVVGSLAGDLRAHMVACFKDAYQRDRDPEQWRSLSMILVGGGSLIQPLEGILGQNLPGTGFCAVKLTSLDDVLGDLGIRVVGASNDPPERADLRFLVPALGLTVPDLLRRDYLPPSAFAGVPAEREPTGAWAFRAEDMYD